FDALKAAGKFPFGQVPILEIEGESAPLAQSRAIEHYLAKQFGLIGSSPVETARIHSFGEGIADFRIEYSKANFWAKPEDKEELVAKFYAEVVPKHLALLNSNVVATDAIHHGDVQLYALVESILSGGKAPADFLDAFTNLKARTDLVASNAAIKTYIANRKVTPF
ncbi:MAG: glutathione S-transferase family protein, partial [archaeon]|nr:glutathione S-transferase family protein [archaeon]